MIILDLQDLRSIRGDNPVVTTNSLSFSTVTIDLKVSRLDDPWPLWDKDHVRIINKGQTLLEGIVTKRNSSGKGEEHHRTVTIADYWYFLEYTPVIEDTPDWNTSHYRPKGDLTRIYPRSPLQTQMGVRSDRNSLTEGSNKAPIATVLKRVVDSGLATIPYELASEINMTDSAEMVPWSTSLINYGQLIRRFLSWRPRMTSRWDYTRAVPTLIIDVPAAI